MAPMKAVLFGALLSLVATVCANPSPEVLTANVDTNTTSYEVIIIGGGPSGLSALSGLARVRRNALLIDSAEYRNAETRQIHDLIGSDGITPAAFRAAARDGISKYPTAHMQNGTVTSIISINKGTAFLISTATGTSYTSKKVILATGLVDIPPNTPGIKEAWSRGIYWCPWCDGYEHREQRFGILGSILDVSDTVQEVHNLNTDIYAFVNGTQTNSNIRSMNKANPNWEAQFRYYNVTLVNTTIARIDRVQDGGLVQSATTNQEFDIFNVVLSDGTMAERDAFITNFPKRQRSYLGTDIGVKVRNEKIAVDQNNMKAAEGVWAVGDANNDTSTNVPHAMFSGKRAAVNIHVELERENAATIHKRAEEDVLALMGREMEDLWARATN